MPKNVKNLYLPSSNYYLRLDIFKTWGWRIYCPRNAMLGCLPVLADWIALVSSAHTSCLERHPHPSWLNRPAGKLDSASAWKIKFEWRPHTLSAGPLEMFEWEILRNILYVDFRERFPLRPSLSNLIEFAEIKSARYGGYCYSTIAI